jgi:hypothetical protein
MKYSNNNPYKLLTKLLDFLFQSDDLESMNLKDVEEELRSRGIVVKANDEIALFNSIEQKEKLEIAKEKRRILLSIINEASNLAQRKIKVTKEVIENLISSSNIALNFRNLESLNEEDLQSIMEDSEIIKILESANVDK